MDTQVITPETSTGKLTKVTVTPHKTKKTLITPYEDKSDFGFINVKQSLITMNGSWTKREKRSALIKGPIDELQDIIECYMDPSTKQMPGQIIVREFQEDEEIPAAYKKYCGKDADMEECFERDAKRVSSDGPLLMNNGGRIIRYSQYFITVPKDVADILVPHDNEDEISQWRAANPKHKDEE